MNALRTLLLLMVALGGTSVVLTREPRAQTIVLTLYGSLLVLLFVAYQAPDVALSQIAVGAVALPLMILLALARIKKISHDDR